MDVILINTIHKERGAANPKELAKILAEEKPNIIFLEALKDTYSRLDRIHYKQFGIYHQKLELAAIQLIENHLEFKYVPVLDHGLLESFEERFTTPVPSENYNRLRNNQDSAIATEGFRYLNSLQAERDHTKLRAIEDSFIDDKLKIIQFYNEIDSYEDNMLKNILAHSETHQFNKAVFLVGSAHRGSLVKKLSLLNQQKESPINWSVYGFTESH